MNSFILSIFTLFFLLYSNLYADKVALLFLTVQDLHHSNLWKKEIKENSDNFSVYIHSKEPLKDKYFKKFRIKHIVPTSWACHVLAWQKLIQAAVKDKKNQKFVFLSESCVPLKPLDEIYKFLLKDDNTYMRYGRPWWPSNHNREVIELPKEHRWGNHEWIILNREHAECVASDKTVIKYVAKHGSDAESYPSSLFSVYKGLDASNIKNIVTTYVNWQHHDGPHPYTFKEASPIDLELFNEAKNQGALFVRKVAASFPSDVLDSLIQY